MEFKSINNKQILEDRLRMTEPSIIFNDDVLILAEHIVDVSEVGRVDLIADKHYRNTDYSEYILKYNNISNPFSISEGDVLIIPDYETSLKEWVRVNRIGDGDVAVDSIRAQFMDTKRLTQKDKTRVEYLKKKSLGKKNGSSEPLPTNILKPGESNTEIKNGIIKF